MKKTTTKAEVEVSDEHLKMSAPIWQVAVDNFVDAEVSDYSSIVNGLLSRNPSLLDIVQYVGKHLTNENPTIRSRVIRLLADVLHQIPVDLLSTEEVKVLVIYFCERLLDHHSVQPPALNGLLALSSFENLPEGCSDAICRSIFQNVQTQTLAQEDRRIVYTIFSTHLNSKLSELQKMEGDFVLGYIQAMDAEKDPRNLMLAFHCARTVILNFPLGVFVEDMFEVVSCYFPIDFTPPANDPHGISREDLISGLRSCLIASPKFGTLCLPLLLEKLSSDIQSAKLDCLQTLCAGAPEFGAECLKEYQGSLFRCIKHEVFSSGSNELEEAALHALTSVSATLSPTLGVSTMKAEVDEFINEVFQDVGRHLKDEDLRLFVPTCHLLGAIQTGSGHACSVILIRVLPLMIDMYNTNAVPTKRKKVLEMLLSFLEKTTSFIESKVEKIVEEHKSSITSILMSAASDTDQSLSASAIQGLALVLSIKVLNSNQDRAVLLSLLSQKVFSDSIEIRKSCEAPIKVLASTDSNLVQTELLPLLYEQIKSDRMDVDGDSNDSANAVFKMLSIIACSSNLKVLSDVLEQLTSCLHVLSKEKYQSDDAVLHKSVCVCECLCDIVTHCVREPESLSLVYEVTLPTTYRLLVGGALGNNKDGCCMCHNKVIECMENLVRQVMCNVNPSKVAEMCAKIGNLFLKCDTQEVLKDTDTVDKWAPLQHSSPWQQTQLVSMVIPVICSCPKQVNLPNVDSYLEQLTVMSLQSKHGLTRDKSVKCIAGLINKYPEGEQLSDFLKQRQNNFDEVMKTAKKSDEKESSLNLWIWVTKALVLRGHGEGRLFFTKLLDVLNDGDVGEQAAAGVHIILNDSLDILNKAMHANIRMMYKQRLFTENAQAMVHGFHQAKEGTKKNFLMALSYMLKTLPKQVLVTELPPLFPLIVQSLLCDHTELQLSTMTTLSDLISDAPEIISKHLDSIANQLLKLCSYQPNMKIRIAALKCMNKLTTLPVPLILPYRAQIIGSLEPRLDDKKRLVRKEAVQTRCLWYLIGQPGK